MPFEYVFPLSVGPQQQNECRRHRLAEFGSAEYRFCWRYVHKIGGWYGWTFLLSSAQHRSVQFERQTKRMKVEWPKKTFRRNAIRTQTYCSVWLSIITNSISRQYEDKWDLHGVCIPESLEHHILGAQTTPLVIWSDDRGLSASFDTQLRCLFL